VQLLADSYGRIATDLRVSLTDRCNLRCAYCMPPEGLDWLPSPALLTDDEVARLVRIGVERLGITEVRFTGGEPLLRRGLPDIVARTAALRPRPEISLTTNGIGLTRLAATLREAGLDRINVSLDTLRPEIFRSLAKRDRLDDVLAGLAAAADAGLTPVKVNAVLMRGLNEDEAVPLLRFCLDHGYQLRFIEQMPLDAQHGWRRDPGRAVSGLPAQAGRRAHPRLGARGDVPGGRGTGPGGRDRLGDQALLRGLRPGPADRRRPGAQLPVRPHREQPS
jgi:cyclic pyranopterin phosphate synthase